MKDRNLTPWNLRADESLVYYSPIWEYQYETEKEALETAELIMNDNPHCYIRIWREPNEE